MTKQNKTKQSNKNHNDNKSIILSIRCQCVSHPPESLFILVQKNTKCKAMDFCSITSYLGSTKYALKFALPSWALATSRSEDTLDPSTQFVGDN